MGIQVIPAETIHSEYIAQILSNYFEENNNANAYNEYKTDYDLLLKHINKRISMGDQTFRYLVALDQDSGEFKGFSNFHVDSEKHKGSILVIVPVDRNDKVTVNALLNGTIDELKTQSLDEILVELGPLDTVLSGQLEEFNSRLLSQKVVVNIQ